MRKDRGFWSRPAGLVALGGLLVIGTGTLVAAGLQAEADPGIRFVDVEKVMVQARPYLERMQKLREEAKRVEEGLNALHEEFKAKGLQRKNFKEGSVDFDQITMELLLLEDKIKFMHTKAEERTKRQHQQLINHVYDLVREAVRAYGQQHKLRGIQVINEFEPAPDEPLPLSVQERKNVLRNVLYFDPSLEITEEILKLVNAR